MGMDVMGNNPISERGEYFRNNVWWWRPLWNYCEELHGDIVRIVENGHSNDGDGLNSRDAYALGHALDQDIESGVTAEYERNYRERIASLPTSECKYCNGTGIRSDEVGVQNGMPTQELDAEVAIIVGRTHGYCNACRGEGRVEHFATNYGFSVENVRNFADFLMDCGGFEIW
jgi:hypothetical protein